VKRARSKSASPWGHEHSRQRPCFYHCPVAVAKTEAGSLTGAVASLGDLCTCENDPPECAFDVVAVCDAGICELAKPPIER
jgi:hypothetical protein